MSAALEARLRALEERLARQEDMTAILQLIAAYGPAVDSLDGSATAAIWAPAGSYDYGAGTIAGAEAVGGVVDAPTHLGYVAAGCGHVLSLPRVWLDGDRAQAVNHSRVYLHDGAGWRVERCSANHWHFIRTADGWRVESRRNRLLDGNAEARALLGRQEDGPEPGPESSRPGS